MGRLRSRNRQNEWSKVLAWITYVGNNGKVASSLPLIEEATKRTIFFHVAQSSEFRIFQGLAITNPHEEEEAKVKIQVRDRFGELSEQRTLVIPPMHRVVGMLDSSQFFGDDFEQLGGSLTILSEVPVVTYSLFGGNQVLAAIEGVKRID